MTGIVVHKEYCEIIGNDGLYLNLNVKLNEFEVKEIDK